MLADGDLLLASCAQDCLIRVWRLVAKSRTKRNVQDERTIRMTEDVFTLTQNGEQTVSGFIRKMCSLELLKMND